MLENQKDNVRNSFCYIPLVAFALFFVENKPSDDLKKHIKYGMILFGGYFILSGVLSVLFLGKLIGIIGFIYILISIFLGFKAYKGEKVDVEILDNISDTIVNKINKK